MRWIRLTLLFLFIGVMGCTTSKVTPLFITDLVEYNSKVVQLYINCSEGSNYTPEKDTCDPELLESEVEGLMGLSQKFIKSDIKQPHGYDVYLETVMIYFRIARRNGDEYSQAEMIARQFFEVQKAYSSRSIHTARYHWAIRAAAHASWQWHYDKLALDVDRKTELLICLSEGRRAQYSMDGPRIIRLTQSLEVLEAIVEQIR